MDTPATDNVHTLNGHPELGDPVYTAGGDEIGTIGFFYDRLDNNKYRVQVAGHAEDPLAVCITQIIGPDGSQSHRVIAMPGTASTVPANNAGAHVHIEGAVA